jgi:Fe2+ or Zn2+ uptake regulation protein
VTVKDEPQFEVMIERLARTTGFTVTSHQLEMQGYCSGCQADAI